VAVETLTEWMFKRDFASAQAFWVDWLPYGKTITVGDDDDDDDVDDDDYDDGDDDDNPLSFPQARASTTRTNSSTYFCLRATLHFYYSLDVNWLMTRTTMIERRW